MLRRIRAIFVCIAAFGCLSLGGSALGDPLADLDAPDYAVRVAATEALLTDASLTLEQVTAWLGGPLSLEQRHRLLAVARHLLLRDLAGRIEPAGDAPPRVALGIRLYHTLVADPTAEPAPAARRMDLNPHALVIEPAADLQPQEIARLVQQRAALMQVEPGRAMTRVVLVVETLPGMPAHGRLRAGDLIEAINGRALHPQLADAQLAELLAAFPAGKPVTLDVVRDGRPLTLTVPVSSMSVLQRLYDDNSRLQAPVREYWRSYLASLDAGTQ